ncbi:MAG: ATP-binding protein [Methylococcales bacterium]|nr:ATP-binding protein [Methylococcales bacterium]
MKSLQLRLGIGLCISLISVFIILWGLTGSSIRNLAEETVAEHLEHDAESIVSAIYIDAANNLALNTERIEPVYLEPFSGDYYQIITDAQVIRSRSLLNQDIVTQVVPPGEKRKLYSVGPNLQPLMLIVYGYNKLGRDITMAVAEDLSPTLARIAAFQHRYTLIALVLLLLLIIVQVIILRTGFHRLTCISQQIRALERGQRAQLDTDVPQEVVALVHEVNWLLKVLDQRLQRSRNALGDLAHALKTPLTVLQQLPRKAELKSQPAVCQILQTQTANMQNIMERVLKRARMAGSGPTFRMFDIKQEITALIKVLQSMYRDKNLSISFAEPETATLLIDREDMLELAGNLLDNACKWAKSRVNIYFDIGEAIHLIVEDDGPGVSDNDFAKLTQRGARLDEAVSGHGLGLAIAQSIAEQYSGQLILRRSDKLGGFYVEAILCKAEPMLMNS